MENNEGQLVLNPVPMPKGKWTINQKKCTTCCECVDACLMGLLFFEEAKKVILIKYEGTTCTQCGRCASACAFDAIVLT